MRLPFIGPTYRHRALSISAQRCVNLFPEKNEAPPGKEGEVAALIGTPGMSLLSDPLVFGAFGGNTRGLHLLKTGQFIAVIGSKLIVVTSVGPPITFVDCGDLLTDTGYVSIDDNGLVAVIVDGPNGYILDLATLAVNAPITDTDFVGSHMVSFIDGYFVFCRPSSGQFYYSGIYSTDIDALDFQTAEGSPDNIVAHVTFNGELWILSDVSTEIFYNSGGDNVFTRNNGAFIEYGCQAENSVVKINNTLVWLGKDRNGGGVVVQADGYQPARISTHTIEQAIQSSGDAASAQAWGYQQDGHSFYLLSLLGLNTTFVYDFAAGEWHERQRLNTETGILERHSAQHSVFAFNTTIVGSYNSPMLYQLRSDKYTDDGAPIVRIRSSPVISKDLRQLFFNSLQLDMETGVGLDGLPGLGTDPMVELRWSDDGCRTWSAPVATPLGKLGEYRVRALWRRLGRGRNRVFEVRMSDPVKFNIVGATADIVAGEH